MITCKMYIYHFRAYKRLILMVKRSWKAIAGHRKGPKWLALRCLELPPVLLMDLFHLLL